MSTHTAVKIKPSWYRLYQLSVDEPAISSSQLCRIWISYGFKCWICRKEVTVHAILYCGLLFCVICLEPLNGFMPVKWPKYFAPLQLHIQTTSGKTGSGSSRDVVRVMYSCQWTNWSQYRPRAFTTWLQNSTFFLFRE